jgi:hypothetical protein
MNKRQEYTSLIKKLVSCESREQLSDTIKEINEFNKEYSITSRSEEFKKFEIVIGIMRVKLKRNHDITESKTYIVSESQFKFIMESNWELKTK